VKELVYSADEMLRGFPVAPAAVGAHPLSSK
jgi:hypothetical protein